MEYFLLLPASIIYALEYRYYLPLIPIILAGYLEMESMEEGFGMGILLPIITTKTHFSFILSIFNGLSAIRMEFALLFAITVNQVFGNDRYFNISDFILLFVSWLSHNEIKRILKDAITWGEATCASSLMTLYIKHLLDNYEIVENLQLVQACMVFGLLAGLYTSHYLLRASNDLLTCGIVVLISFLLVQIIGYCIQIDPFFWTMEFISDKLGILIFWILVIIISVYNASYWELEKSSWRTDLKRKYFHLLVVLMFLPALHIYPQLLNLALVVCACIFFLFEVFRLYKVEPISTMMKEFFEPFLDERDRYVTISHLYLLLGCALPVWISHNLLWKSCGIVSIGVGDALASIGTLYLLLVGKRFGSIKWPGRKKSVQGTIAFILGVWVVFKLQTFLINESFSWTAIILTALVEAFTEQNDNIILPLFFLANLDAFT